MDKPKTDRICIRLPTNMIKQLDEIETSTSTRSYKIRKAIKEYCNKEVERAINNIYKQKL